MTARSARRSASSRPASLDAINFLLADMRGALGAWLRGLLARAHPNTAVVALANKLARIVWAVLRSGSAYQAGEAQPA